MKRSTKLVLGVSGLFLGLLVYGIASVRAQPNYAFIHADHPIDMIYDKDGQWLYYFVGGEPKDVAERARKDLIPSGFAEDTAHKPWFHFSSGGREVIVCNHDQIMTMRNAAGNTSLIVEPPRPTPPGYDPSHNAVIWVRSPGRGSGVTMAFFQIRKLIFQW